jgi:hypothetical protein
MLYLIDDFIAPEVAKKTGLATLQWRRGAEIDGIEI